MTCYRGSSSIFTLIIIGIFAYGNASPAGNDATFDQRAFEYEARSAPRPQPGTAPHEKWAYSNVRPHCYMFWWLYYSTAPEGYHNKPLVIWLQGGPGASSTGFGNFAEIGPLDQDLKPRATSWVSQASLLFIDNPVGTGYSYVTSDKVYAVTVAEIAADLLTMLSDFLVRNTEFEKIPLYIFSESYGGKMAAAFAQQLYDAILNAELTCNFYGVALGDSWISPMDYVNTWGPFLYATSLVDEPARDRINKAAAAAQAAYDAHDYTRATDEWSNTEGVVDKETSGVNVYNILKWGESSFNASAPQLRNMASRHLRQLYMRHVTPLAPSSLDKLMNGVIRRKLGVIPANVTWNGQSGEVFTKMSEDFMKPVISIVDDLVSNTWVKVIVYNGQLDLICDTLGTEMWLQRLNWVHVPDFTKAPREALKYKNGTPWGFRKHWRRLHMYWLLDSGHMVPQDVGEAALEMLTLVLSEK